MKKLLCAALAAVMLCGCTAAPAETTDPDVLGAMTREEFEEKWAESGHTTVFLSDGAVVASDTEAVTTANDIIYYEAGHDETYGEGEAGEAHTPEEAAAHTVVHITRPGTYVLNGRLSAGQIAVDLGEDAGDDPGAVVTLILDNVDITCSVAPAVIFYNVYECGDRDNPSATVDTSAAGANVILAKDSVNKVVGSHVAKIYKPETVIDGNTDDAKKLHKYDAAFYSKMSMNVDGEGYVFIDADNEGLDSELHLTVNGGFIHIESGNDGINTNEDGVSVTTINGGTVDIIVSGETGEGDGIDSNGWLVINGGTVKASACGISGDAGIDSDMGIHINGGTVCASGNMLDHIENGGQTHIVFTFAGRQQPGNYTLKNAAGAVVADYNAVNDFQYLILSSPELSEGDYTLWSGEQQYQGAGGMIGGFMGGAEIQRPDWPRDDADVEIPPQPTQPMVPQSTQGEMPTVPAGETMPTLPEGFDPGQQPPEGMPEPPEGGMTPPMPGGQPGGFPGGQGAVNMTELKTVFSVTAGANYFTGVCAVE